MLRRKERVQVELQEEEQFRIIPPVFVHWHSIGITARLIYSKTASITYSSISVINHVRVRGLLRALQQKEFTAKATLIPTTLTSIRATLSKTYNGSIELHGATSRKLAKTIKTLKLIAKLSLIDKLDADEGQSSS